MYSQIGSALIGNKSVYQPRGWQAATPVAIDDTVYITPSSQSQSPAFGSTIVFDLPKNSTLIGKCYIAIRIAPAQFNASASPAPAVAGAQAAFSKNVGDLILNNVVFRYGSNVLQSYPGYFQAMWRRLTRNDTHIEGVNAQVLGNIPPGAATEGALVQALGSLIASDPAAGVTLYCPLDELYFHHSKDEFWMPEAHALEGQLYITLEQLQNIVYTCTGTGSTGGTEPFTSLPTISSVFLYYQEVTLSAAEKQNRLSVYKTPEGQIIKFLDLEQQVNQQFVGGQTAVLWPAPFTNTTVTRTMIIPLDNFRMDMAEIIFALRWANISGSGSTLAPGVQKTWSGSKLESNPSNSIVTGGNIATYVTTALPNQGMLTFVLQANGKQLYQFQPERWNREQIRAFYHPDSQVADAIYVIPFAQFPGKYYFCEHVQCNIANIAA